MQSLILIVGNLTCRQLLKFTIKWNRYWQVLILKKTTFFVVNRPGQNELRLNTGSLILHYTSPFHTFQGNHQIFQWNFSGMCVRLLSITFPVIWSSILSWFQWLEWRYRGLVMFFRKNNIAKMLVCPVPKISQVMLKWHRWTSQLGRFTLWTSNLSPGLTNIWTSRSLLWWVVLRR